MTRVLVSSDAKHSDTSLSDSFSVSACSAGLAVVHTVHAASSPSLTSVHTGHFHVMPAQLCVTPSCGERGEGTEGEHGHDRQQLRHRVAVPAYLTDDPHDARTQAIHDRRAATHAVAKLLTQLPEDVFTR